MMQGLFPRLQSHLINMQSQRRTFIGCRRGLRKITSNFKFFLEGKVTQPSLHAKFKKEFTSTALSKCIPHYIVPPPQKHVIPRGLGQNMPKCIILFSWRGGKLCNGLLKRQEYMHCQFILIQQILCKRWAVGCVIYRVTHPVMTSLPLTSKQKFSF